MLKLVSASGGKPTVPVVAHVFENTHVLLGRGGWGVLTFVLTCVKCTFYVTSLVGGWDVLTFMLTCVTCTCYVTPWVGVGWVVPTFMLTCVTCTCYVTPWVGVGWVVPTFMLTCVTCRCYVTSWVGGLGGGRVNVHVNLRRTHMLRHVWVSPCWHHNCRMRTDVDTDVKGEQLVTCRRSASCRDLLFIQSECYVS